MSDPRVRLMPRNKQEKGKAMDFMSEDGIIWNEDDDCDICANWGCEACV